MSSLFESVRKRWKAYVTPFRVILGIELLLLVYSICQYAFPLHRYVYEGTDLTGDHCSYLSWSNDYGVGCYLDDSLELENPEDLQYLYMTTPYVDLPKGSYQISVVYATDQEQRITYTSKYRTYSVIADHERMTLPAGELETNFYLFSPIKVEEFQVHADYTGAGYFFVESISINETNAWKNILLFYVILFSLILDMIILIYRKLSASRRKEMRIVLFVLLSLGIFTSMPVFSYFMPNGDDLTFHLNRIEAIKDSILNGQLPNRVSSYWNNGYGYASAVFYGEVFLYIPALLRIIGFSVQAAYKFYIIAVNFATALISWYCFKKVFHEEKVALVGCMLYMLAPYRIVSIFMRAAVGEYTAMAFFPLIFYGLYLVYTGNPDEAGYKRAWVPAMLGYTGIIQSHVISCVMVGIFTGLFCLVFLKKTLQPKRLCQLFKIGIVTVILNLWFLVPFADYFLRGYTNSAGNPLGRFQANGAFLSQIFSFFQQGTGSSYSVAESFTFPNERNYALGGFLLIIFFYILVRLYRGKGKSRMVRIGDYSLGFAALSLFMCTVWFPWDWFQQMNGLFRMITQNIQLPWRFLGLSCFFLTLTAMALVSLLHSMPNRHFYYGTVTVICVASLLAASYFLYDYTQNGTFSRYYDGSDLSTCSVGLGEYIPEDTPQDFSADNHVVPGDSLEITEDRREADVQVVSCVNEGDQDTFADIPFLPYNGYRCIDSETGSEMEIQLDIPGKVRVIVPVGYSGTFTVSYQEPWYWRVSEGISLLLFVLEAGYFMVSTRRKKYHEE